MTDPKGRQAFHSLKINTSKHQSFLYEGKFKYMSVGVSVLSCHSGLVLVSYLNLRFLDSSYIKENIILIIVDHLIDWEFEPLPSGCGCKLLKDKKTAQFF